MKIHVISHCEVSKDHLLRLKKLGDVRVSDMLKLSDPEFVKSRVDADILMVLPRPKLDFVPYLKKCKFISIMSTGIDGINTALAHKNGIKMSSVPEYATESVAEHIFSLMLVLARNIKKADEVIRKNKWDDGLIVESFELFELKNKTLGIFGFGKIGMRVSEIAKSFEMNVVAHTKNVKNPMPDIDYVSFEKLLSDSNFIVLSAPLTSDTFHKFGENEFKKMKKKPFIINTARGAIIDEKALIKALKNKWVRGAGLDVFEKERVKNNPFVKFENVVLTPHVAFGSKEALDKMIDVSTDNIEAFLKGTPKNIVNF
ncbi:MAG: glycerate dehydrogenase [Candidatus Peregrinibacteria bacterium GW2011_GWC2_39_14]|nr:MAG: glycerate dehydrogenase [Candidatus Peregrinibacteria bacterium GW2011_GWC2_39_14]